jgi:hypothetical protein
MKYEIALRNRRRKEDKVKATRRKSVSVRKEE